MVRKELIWASFSHSLKTDFKREDINQIVVGLCVCLRVCLFVIITNSDEDLKERLRALREPGHYTQHAGRGGD